MIEITFRELQALGIGVIIGTALMVLFIWFKERQLDSALHSIQHKAKDGIKLPEPPKGKSALC